MLLFSLSMVTWMIDEFGSEELREKYVPALASMEVKFIVLLFYFVWFFCFILEYNNYLYSIMAVS